MSDGNPNHLEPERLRLIIRDETNKLLLAHLRLCPFVSNEIEKRTRHLETQLAKLIGFMIGSGLLGGMSGAAVAKLLN